MPALTPTVAEYMPLTKYVPAKFEAASSTATAEKMLPCMPWGLDARSIGVLTNLLILRRVLGDKCACHGCRKPADEPKGSTAEQRANVDDKAKDEVASNVGQDGQLCE